MFRTGFIWVFTILLSFHLVSGSIDYDSLQNEDESENVNTPYITLSRHIELGQDHIFNLKFSEALNNFEAALNKSENDSSILQLCNALKDAETGLMFLEEGSFNNAGIMFEAAFKLSNKPLFNSLKLAAYEANNGVVLMKEGLFSDASKKFSKARLELPIELLYWNRHVDKTIYTYVNDSNVAYQTFSNCEDSAQVAASGLTMLQSCNFADGLNIFYLAVKSSKVPRIKDVVENDWRFLIDVSATASMLKKSKFTLAAESLAEAGNKTITPSVKKSFSKCRNAFDTAIKGLEYISKGDFLEASASFQEAYKKSNGDDGVFVTEFARTFASFKQLSDIAVSGHTLAEAGAFGEASSKFQDVYDRTSFSEFLPSFALCKNAADSLNVGLFFFKEGMFDEAFPLFTHVVDSECGCMNDVAKNLYDVSINARDAINLIKTGNITHALEKFEHACAISYLSNITDMLKNCKYSLSIFLEGQKFVEDMEFHKAADKFQEAYDMSNVNKVKFLLSQQRKRFTTLCQ